MNDDTLLFFDLPSVCRKKLTVDFSGGNQSSKGGLLLLLASGTPVVAILRPARTPKGTEVRTVIKHVTKRLRQHWPNTRILWRGDGHYGRVEAMEWA